MALPPTLDCVETVHAEANDALTAYISKRDNKFSLTFTLAASGNYMMVGNLGASEMVTVRREGFVQLIEESPVGNLYLTTILTEPENGIYNAVHSRNSVILGTLTPSQYLLACRAR